MRKTTIKDVAAAVGVSPTTVSLVLNNKSCRISEETRKNILNKAASMNYRPNQLAVSLISQKTNTIGLLLPDISNVFFSDIAKIVETESYKHGYNIFIGNSTDDYKKDYEYLNLFIDRQVDAIIMIPSSNFDETFADKFFDIIKHSIIPVVVIDRKFHSGLVNTIMINQELGGYLATKHLISLGHRKIGCITGPMNLSNAKQRLTGYQKALEEFSIPYQPSIIYNGDFSVQSGIDALPVMTANGVSAVFCCNDMMALGLYKECIRFQIDIPKDLSIIGFDNIYLTSFLNPPLTTIAQPMEEIAKTAVSMAVALIDGKPLPEQTLFDPYLKIRGSTKYHSTT